MASYVLDCNTSEAVRTLDAWPPVRLSRGVQRPNGAMRAVAQLMFESVGDGKSYVDIQCEWDDTVRKILFTTLGVLFTTAWLIAFVARGTKYADCNTYPLLTCSVSSIAIILISLFAFCLLLITWLLLFGIELKIIEHFTNSGIAVHRTSTNFSWSLFPFDYIVTLLVMLLPGALLQDYSFSLYDLIFWYSPLIIIFFLAFFAGIIQRFNSSVTNSNVHPYQYAQVTIHGHIDSVQLAIAMSSIFYFISWFVVHNFFKVTSIQPLAYYFDTNKFTDTFRIIIDWFLYDHWRHVGYISVDHMHMSFMSGAHRLDTSTFIISTLAFLTILEYFCLIFWLRKLVDQTGEYNAEQSHAPQLPTFSVVLRRSAFTRHSQVMTIASIVWDQVHAVLLVAISSTISVLALLWLVGWGSPPVPLKWMAPFAWYRAALETSLGPGLGGVLAVLATWLLFLPGLLWLLGWATAVARDTMSSVAVLRRRAPPHDPFRRRLRWLCRQMGVPEPVLVVDEQAEAPSSTTPILPFLRTSVVRVSRPVLAQLSPTERDVLLAHELGHVVLHARRLWCVQLASRVCLLGPGALAVLLDYPAMELEADKFAIRATGARRACWELLSVLDAVQLRAQMHAAVADLPRGGPRHLPARLLALPMLRPVAVAYNLLFGPALWGYARPSTQERMVALGFDMPDGQVESVRTRLCTLEVYPAHDFVQ